MRFLKFIAKTGKIVLNLEKNPVILNDLNADWIKEEMKKREWNLVFSKN